MQKETISDEILLRGLRVLLAKATEMNPDFRLEDWFGTDRIMLAQDGKELSQER